MSPSERAARVARIRENHNDGRCVSLCDQIVSTATDECFLLAELARVTAERDALRRPANAAFRQAMEERDAALERVAQLREALEIAEEGLRLNHVGGYAEEVQNALAATEPKP